MRAFARALRQKRAACCCARLPSCSSPFVPNQPDRLFTHRSDGTQPHLITIQFERRVELLVRAGGLEG
jgi:hypothetical protein